MKSKGLTKASIPDRVPPKFWSKVRVGNSSDCWPYFGTKRGEFGYRQVSFDSKYLMAHVVAYALTRGDVPQGMLVCHHCDNPQCVNPNHLYIGTYLDNNRDRERRGRGGNRKGERNGRAILTAEKVKAIRAKCSDGHYDDIASEYGVKTVTVAKIAQGKLWKHLL